MRTLYVIPARGGSKGIPGKNIKPLGGKPLIQYSIDIARRFAADSDICVSTDCPDILAVVRNYGLLVPFKRPDELSGDYSGTQDVLLHALNFFAERGQYYDRILLLQPTSPFRREEHIADMIKLYSEQLDMVVSVGTSHHNPYFTLFEENEFGFLEKSKTGNFETRQEAPPVYFYNGSLYLINCDSLKRTSMQRFKNVKKYLMDDLYSVDIDTPLDWAICETIISEGYIKNENN